LFPYTTLFRSGDSSAFRARGFGPSALRGHGRPSKPGDRASGRGRWTGPPRRPPMTAGRLLIVAGTGTGIGKTDFSEALLIALSALYPRVAGVKPIETGMGEATVSDASRLERVSSFHVKHFGYVFAEPVSPHLAARESDTPIRLDVLVPLIQAAQAKADVLLVELPGGLFTPLSDTEVNADLVRALMPDITLLIAPDRLGVLHEVLSTHRAASTAAVELNGIV